MTTDQILGTPIEAFKPEPLPLTKGYVQFMQDRIKHYSDDIAQLDSTESRLLAELHACRAVRASLIETQQRYKRDLGGHYAPPAVEQPVWPVQPGERGSLSEACPKCGNPMYLTAQYGNIHEIEGPHGTLWVAAGEWCVQPTGDGRDES